MSEEEKVSPEATEAEDTSVQDEQSTDVSHETKEDSTQLEAALKREREAREKAEKAAADTAFKLREERRRQKEESSDEVDEDKPLTAKDLQRLMAEEREATQKMLQEKETANIVASLSDNSTEQALILEVYKNRSFPAHLSLSEKLEEAYLIANKDRVMGENKELKRALLSKKTVVKDSSTTHQDGPTGSKPKLAPADAQVYAEAGFTWNDNQKRWQKKLPNGQFLIKVKGGGNQVVSA